MIKNEREYMKAVEIAKKDAKFIEEQESRMLGDGATPKQIKLALAPLRTFLLSLQEEIAEYKKYLDGIDEIEDYEFRQKVEARFTLRRRYNKGKKENI